MDTLTLLQVFAASGGGSLLAWLGTMHTERTKLKEMFEQQLEQIGRQHSFAVTQIREGFRLEKIHGFWLTCAAVQSNLIHICSNIRSINLSNQQNDEMVRLRAQLIINIEALSAAQIHIDSTIRKSVGVLVDKSINITNNIDYDGNVKPGFDTRTALLGVSDAVSEIIFHISKSISPTGEFV